MSKGDGLDRRKRWVTLMAAVATALISPAASFAQGTPPSGFDGGLQLLEQLEFTRAGADAIAASMSLVQFEKQYCLPPDSPSVAQEEQFLKARETSLAEYQRRYRALRDQLIDLIVNDGNARRAVETKFPGTNPVDASFWARWESAFGKAQAAIRAKREELSRIPEVSCRSVPQPQAPPPPPQGPGLALPSVTVRPVEIPPIPGRFCSDAEKQAALARFRAVSWDFYMNYQDAREFHDAIVAAIDRGRGNTGVLQGMLPEAKRNLDFHAQRLDEFQKALERISAMPVEDCGDPAQQPPADPITQPEYELFVFPEAPDVFCTEDEKAATIGALRSARDAARRNYDKAAAMVIAMADRIAKGDQSTTTSAAFQEASDAASAWLKQSQGLDASLQQAEALPISDCTKAPPSNSLPAGTAVNPDDTSDAARDETSQLFAAESPGGTVPAGTPNEDAELAEVLRGALFSGPAAVPEVGRGAADVEMYFLALGGSTGPVVRLFSINRSGETVQLPADFLVLEPVRITPEAQARIGTLLQGIVDRGGRQRVLDAYCLEFLRQPPAAGTVLRMANPSTTQRFAQAKRVLETAKRLRDFGRLTPDSDPAEYYHAIRQWATWTHQERFDLGRFEDAFVRIARKGYADAGDAWTTGVEQGVRALVPNRWKDIQAVLREAGLR